MAANVFDAMTDEQKQVWVKQMMEAEPKYGVLRSIMPEKPQQWFAWYPVRLSTVGDTFYFRNQPWAWMRYIGRWRMDSGRWYYEGRRPRRRIPRHGHQAPKIIYSRR